jgi:hypothetical protein
MPRSKRKPPSRRWSSDNLQETVKQVARMVASLPEPSRTGTGWYSAEVYALADRLRQQNIELQRKVGALPPGAKDETIDALLAAIRKDYARYCEAEDRDD